MLAMLYLMLCITEQMFETKQSELKCVGPYYISDAKDASLILVILHQWSPFP